MSLNYTKVSSSGQLANGDWEEFGEDFEFEVDWYEVEDALKHILSDYSKEDLIKIIIDFDSEAVDLQQFFKDELTEYFRKEAMKNGR